MAKTAPAKRKKRRQVHAALIEAVKVYLPSLLVLAIGFYAAYQFVEPAPPKAITVYSGQSGGMYHKLALIYKERLADFGIRAKVIETAGASENLIRLVEAGTADETAIAFTQSGLDAPADADLIALASLYYEPLWLFHKDTIAVSGIRDLSGLSAAVGAKGSGTRALVDQLYRLNEVAVPASDAAILETDEIAPALSDGTLDAAFLVGGETSKTISELLHMPGIALADFRRAPAYARILPYLEELSLPEGAINLAENNPPKPVKLIGTTAMLVANKDIHPALIDMLLTIATDVHTPAGLFEKAGEFPSARLTSLPMHDHAARFLSDGPSFLQRVLPFWAATLIDRWLVMLLPLITLLIPLMRIVPPLYDWRVRARITRPYKKLRKIEATEPPRGDALEQLDKLEEDIKRLSVPPTYAGELYALKFHIKLLRDQLERSDVAEAD